MKNISYSELIKRIQKNINLVCAYLQDDSFDFIIKSCRLKPISIFNKQFNKNFKLDNIWFDEFGNSLVIKNNECHILYDDSDLKLKKIISTDLFSGRNLKEISKISNLIYIFYSDNKSCISLMDEEGYLRTFIHEKNEWMQSSSLILGLNTLKLISKNHKLINFVEIDLQANRNILIDSCSDKIEWLSCWPANEEFLNELKQIELFNNITGDR